LKAAAEAKTQGQASATARLDKDGLTAEARAKVEAAVRAGATVGDIVRVGVLAQAQAEAVARAVFNKDGLAAEATARAGADVNAQADVYLPGGGQWNTQGTAGATAEATAKATWNREDGFQAETGATAGAYAEASTKMGTDRSHLSASVRAGAAAGAGGSAHASVDKGKESLTLGGCAELTLVAGATACASQEFHNPLGKAKRDSYVAGITSGDAGTVAGTIARGAGEIAGVILNPTKIGSEILGFKPKNTAEQVISHIPLVNIGAALGRGWGWWQLQQLRKLAQL
jgi:hypothetical protein